jgi:hypothetical protein
MKSAVILVRSAARLVVSLLRIFLKGLWQCDMGWGGNWCAGWRECIVTVVLHLGMGNVTDACVVTIHHECKRTRWWRASVSMDSYMPVTAASASAI